eukprot:GFYU01010678.1.p1 GENE.GFYU01010678.1~~GFYU01010678.1.p1  ORF type:complete len:279 (+),score=105.81 GFYU01010678.1:59-895(+)
MGDSTNESESRQSFLSSYQRRKSLSSVQFMQIFKHYDKDGNGVIDVNELDGFIKDLLIAQGKPASVKDIQELRCVIIDTYDKNGNGKIELQELAAMFPQDDNFLLQFKNKHKLTSVQFMSVFRQYDEDNNGYIESTELLGFLKDLMEKEGQTATLEDLETYKDAMLEMFDVNKDGKLELDELLKILPTEQNYLEKFKNKTKLKPEEFEDIWKHYDADGNNSIEAVELEALMRDLIIRDQASVTHTELQEFKKALLDVCDTNKDGKIQKEELQKLLPLE